jgi:hypothetical protein
LTAANNNLVYTAAQLNYLIIKIGCWNGETFFQKFYI